MKFLADMGISPGVVRALRKQGHDPIHLQEQGLGRLPDGEILMKARAEGRVVLTHDLDFGELLAASGGILPSVIIFRLKDMRAENVSQHLSAILDQQTGALLAGAVCSVSERKARIRTLPL
jgi:predicted nuclease of predicted toxin-antitoxin system